MKIWNEILLIDKLRKEHKLTAEEYKILLECQDSNCLSYLQKQAQEEALSRFGNRVFIRGLIEVTNRCRNNCYYCGIRERRSVGQSLRTDTGNNLSMLP